MRAEITRDAHAHLGKRYGFISKFIKIVLLIGSTTSTTLIFTRNFDEEVYLLMAGIFSLILFILSLVELVLNFEKNAETHNQAVIQFTSLIRDLNRVQEIKMSDEKTLVELQDKYDWIRESSPWIQDKDFLEAKRRFKIKTDINRALDDDINRGKSIKQLENAITAKVE
jgi:biopolymer transport protein ExbB/TolQ